jgi:hypothetical protein
MFAANGVVEDVFDDGGDRMFYGNHGGWYGKGTNNIGIPNWI